MKKDGKTSKIKTAVISLIAAMLVWAAITYINPPLITTTISNPPVRFTGEEALRERGFTVVDKDGITGLSVEIEGRRNDLISFSDGVCVEVDVSSVTEAGEYNLAGNVTVPSGAISIADVKFNTVPVRVDKVASKEIPIRVTQTGSVSGRLVKTVPEEETVLITGAQSEIDNVSYGEATADITPITEDTVIEAGYVLMNKSNSPIDRNETISASKTQININCSVYEAVTLPVRAALSDELAADYAIDADSVSITPSTVEVGLKDMSIDHVEARITDTGSASECALIETEGMYIPENAGTVRVRAKIGKKTTKTLTVGVTARNLTAGLTAHIEPITVTVTGIEADLTAENITASADLSDYRTGTHSVPVTVEGGGATVNGSYTANVTIS